MNENKDEAATQPKSRRTLTSISGKYCLDVNNCAVEMLWESHHTYVDMIALEINSRATGPLSLCRDICAVDGQSLLFLGDMSNPAHKAAYSALYHFTDGWLSRENYL